MSQIRLTESQLHRMVEDAIYATLNESVDEGIWDQMRSAANGFFGKNGKAQAQPRTGNFQWKNRFNAAKAGWKGQGEMDDYQDDYNTLQEMIKKHGWDFNMTLSSALSSLSSRKGRSKRAMGKASDVINDTYKQRAKDEDDAWTTKANGLRTSGASGKGYSAKNKSNLKMGVNEE